MNRQRPSSTTHIMTLLKFLLVAVAVGALLLLGMTTAGQLAADLAMTMIGATAATTASTIRTHGQPARTSLTSPPNPDGHPIVTNDDDDERALTTEGYKE